MQTRSYLNHNISVKLFLAILTILISQEVKAQYIASPAQLAAPATTPGNYYNETSITLSPGFSATATSTNSYSYFIQTSCVPLGINLSQNQNYILTSVPREAGIDPAGNNTNCKLMQTVQYFDGLGRPLQTVQIKGSPTSKDIVQPVTYDQFGREAKKYLPYTITNGASDGSYKSDALTVNAGQDQFYKSPPAGLSIIPYPSESTGFEPSPLNRVVEKGASGQPWQLSTSGVTGSGHTIQMAYGSNVTDDAVIMWVVNASGAGAAGSSNYGANQLYKTTTTDENGNSTMEFTDKKGHVVCRKAQSGATSYLATYYIYDDFDNLAYVIPPLPAGTVYPASFTEADAVFTNFIYGYHYDLRNREIEKKIPGKAWEYMVYNTQDQIVATQDGIQRAKSTQEWSFTKYDQFGRVAYSGIYQYPGSTAGTSYRAALQTTLDGQTTLWETQQTTGTGYSGTAWPQANILRYLVLIYYDNYTFPNKPYSSAVSNTLTNPTGLPTATKTAVLLPDGTYGSMLWTVNFYDDRGRLVQTDKQHYLGGEAGLNTLNYDEIDNIYNFNDQVKTTTRHHYVANSQALLVTTNYQYDHMGRKLQTSEAISTGLSQAPLPTIISQLDYNEIGQLKTKHLHSTNNGGSFLQDISYTYNERGWLSQINDPSVAPTANKLFSEKLNYNLPQFGAQAQFNGNIAEQQYNAGISGNQHVNYSYDNLNRLKAGVSTAGFSETISNYDNLGNIQGLTRTAPNSASLTYNYIGNQLQTVTNSGTAFRSYGYDLNGNATSDGQGNAISYNMIDLPRSVASKNLIYTYLATGEKLRKSSNGSITEYIGGIQYRPDGTIDFVQTEEGRANRSGTNYVYEYTLTDHLGNNRVTFDQTNGKVGEDDYYPFGLNVHRQVNGGNKYLYNNKELQEELNQYDYGARFYDPVIARWTSVDPMAEGSRRFSPFIYGNNNPIRFIDPDGRFAGLGAPWKPNNDLDDQKKDPFSGMLTNVADPIDPSQQSKADNEATSQLNDANETTTDSNQPPKTEDEKKHEYELAAYGTLKYGFSTSVSGAFSLGFSIEVGWVATDKNFVRYYITLSGAYGLAGASTNGNLFMIFPTGNKNYKPTFMDWEGTGLGGSVSRSIGKKGGGVGPIGGLSEHYKSVGVSFGFGKEIPFLKEAKGGAMVTGGRTRFISNAVYMRTPKEFLGDLWNSYINMYRHFR